MEFEGYKFKHRISDGVVFEVFDLVSFPVEIELREHKVKIFRESDEEFSVDQFYFLHKKKYQKGWERSPTALGFDTLFLAVIQHFIENGVLKFVENSPNNDGGR